VARAYTHTPAANIALSTMSVAGTEFHNPSPTFVESPGMIGRSGRCVIQTV